MLFRIVAELRSEIEKLRQQGSSGTSVEDNEAHLALVAQLKDKLTQKEHEMDAVAKYVCVLVLGFRLLS